MHVCMCYATTRSTTIWLFPLNNLAVVHSGVVLSPSHSPSAFTCACAHMRSDISVLMRTARVHAQGRAQAQPHGATWDRRSGGRRRGGGLPGNPHAHIHAHPALRACAGRAMHMGQQPASMRAAISPALPAAKPGFLAALVSFGAHAH